MLSLAKSKQRRKRTMENTIIITRKWELATVAAATFGTASAFPCAYDPPELTH